MPSRSMPPPSCAARPLAMRCGAFGDMVLLTALIRVLHAQFRCPVDIVTSGPWSEPLLRGQPGVGEILSMRSRKTPYWLNPDQRRVVRALRARGTGPTWCCDGDDESKPILTRAGIGGEWIVDAREHPLLPGEHATEQWRRLAQIMPRACADAPNTRAHRVGAHDTSALNVDANGAGERAADPAGVTPGCYLAVSPAQHLDLDQWLNARGLGKRPLILIQIGNKRTMRRGLRRLSHNSKYWPNERWAEVLRFLRSRHPQHAIVLLGTGPEYLINQDLAALARVADVHNAADDLPIPRLVALLERGCGLITVDSGPAHAAAAVGCPQVVLFGRASTTLYRPRGTAGAEVKVLTGEVDGEPNMLGIDAREVMAAWAALTLREAV